MKIFIKGLNGCWMRKTDIRQYRDFFLLNGHEIVNNPAQSDINLLWTCGFREDFRGNSLSQIERYQREFSAELVVAGCLPDIDGELLGKYFRGRVINWRNDEPKLEAFFGSRHSFSAIDRLVGEPKLCNDVASYRKNYLDQGATFADQFIKLHISEGCRFECSYCSERLAFPPYRSFPEPALIEACRRIIEQRDQKEVMLLGDSVGDYGHDIGSSLPALIRKIKAIRPGVTISFHGLNPAHFLQFYDEMTEFLSRGDIQHISLPIQSAADRVLTLMRRPYGRAGLDRIFGLFKRVGFRGFETHLIIGFPSETEEECEETLEYVCRHRPRYVLVSGFMEASAAAASRLPGKVGEETKQRRLKDAESRIRSAGIICNTDNSELSTARFRAINRI